jgi:hypothetical protein
MHMNNLSLVHLIVLIAGILLILLLRRKYQKIRTAELIGIIVLYALLVFLFTEPIVNLIKKLLD